MPDAPLVWRLPTLLFTILCGAALAWFPQDGRPFWEIMRWDDQTTFPVFLAIALTLFLPVAPWERHDQFLTSIDKHPGIFSSALFACLAGLAPWIYHGKPLSTDEYLLWFQAHSFAQGSLFASYPPEWLPHIFGADELFIADWKQGLLLSPYWPGFSLLLAPFSAIGLPWLCNPAIVGLSAYVLWLISHELFDDPRARGLTLLLATASSAFFFNGVTFYAMPAHLLFNAIFAWLLLRPNAPRAFLAGVIGSFALVLHNPLPHLLFALPWIAWLAVTKAKQTMLPLITGYVPLTLLLGVGWVLLRLSSACSATCASASHAFEQSGATLSAAGSFGTSAFTLPNWEILEWRSAGTVKLWLSSVPGLVVLACVTAKYRREAPFRLFAASGLATFLGYFFIPFDQGFGWGNRYFHSAWLVLPLLATAAIARGHTHHASTSAADLYRLSRAACLSVLLLFPDKGFVMLLYATEHWKQLPPHQGTQDEIVFKNGIGHWPLFLAQNPPDLSGAPTVFLSRGRKRDSEFIAKFFPRATLAGGNGYGTTYRVPPDERPGVLLNQFRDR